MKDNMREDVQKVLVSEEEIREKVKEMGRRITEDYKGKNLLLVTVLKGAVVFLADLMREIDVPVRRQDWESAAYTYLEEVLTLCRDNADIYRALVCNSSDPEFERQFVATLREQFLRGFVSHVCRTEERVQELYCVYIVQGMLAVVSVWLNEGTRETPAEMARLGAEFIIRGSRGLR